MENIFTKIYDKQVWKSSENCPLSGSGSGLKYNEKYTKWLQDFITRSDINTVLDIGCGDWTFSKTINWDSVNYHGVDVVESVIEKNITEFSKHNIKFSRLDISQNLNSWIDYDLIIIKDVLQHWNNNDIIKVLDYLVNISKPRYIVIVNGNTTRDIGDRPMNTRFHYSPLRLDRYPLNKYPITNLFTYKKKVVGIIRDQSLV